MNLAQAVDNFIEGKFARASSFASFGTHAVSYSTTIATRTLDGRLIQVTPHKYSVTTSRHTNTIKRAALANGYTRIEDAEDGWEQYTDSPTI